MARVRWRWANRAVTFTPQPGPPRVIVSGRTKQGKRSVGIQTFWLQAARQNQIEWEPVEVIDLSRKHTANVRDVLREIRVPINRLVERRDDAATASPRQSTRRWAPRSATTRMRCSSRSTRRPSNSPGDRPVHHLRAGGRDHPHPRQVLQRRRPHGDRRRRGAAAGGCRLTVLILQGPATGPCQHNALKELRSKYEQSACSLTHGRILQKILCNRLYSDRLAL